MCWRGFLLSDNPPSPGKAYENKSYYLQTKNASKLKTGLKGNLCFCYLGVPNHTHQRRRFFYLVGLKRFYFFISDCNCLLYKWNISSSSFAKPLKRVTMAAFTSSMVVISFYHEWRIFRFPNSISTYALASNPPCISIPATPAFISCLAARNAS